MKIIEKFTKPTMFDDMPYGTIIKVCDEEQEDCKYYIQIGNEDAKPKWLISSDFFNLVFTRRISDNEFMKDCLNALKY